MTTNEVKTDWIADLVAGAPKLLTVPEAADLLRISGRTLARKIAAGAIASIGGEPGGTKRLIPRAALEVYLRGLE
ncbi:MAG TPA: helix-turn-helix domain-containing protein [Polyangiaceae bacterium]|nr:helix-turn-helix domain-containing protein [Polyangiaceae bacterium]